MRLSQHLSFQPYYNTKQFGRFFSLLSDNQFLFYLRKRTIFLVINVSNQRLDRHYLRYK